MAVTTLEMIIQKLEIIFILRGTGLLGIWFIMTKQKSPEKKKSKKHCYGASEDRGCKFDGEIIAIRRI